MQKSIKFIPTSFSETSRNKGEKMARPQFDDEELYEVVVPSKGKKEEVKKKHQDEDEEESSSNSNSFNDGEDDVDFGDEDLMKSTNFERLVVKDKGKFARFTILPHVKPKKAWSHYVEGEGKGSFRCFSDNTNKKSPREACCKALGEPNLDVIALVLHYTNASAKDGKLEKGVPVEFDIKYVKLSRAQFRDISNLAEEDGSVYGIDIVMSLKNNGIGYQYNRISSKAKYLSNPELVKAVEEAVEPYLNGEKMTKRLPKKIKKSELNGYLAAAGGDDEADMNEIEDV